MDREVYGIVFGNAYVNNDTDLVSSSSSSINIITKLLASSFINEVVSSKTKWSYLIPTIKTILFWNLVSQARKFVWGYRLECLTSHFYFYPGVIEDISMDIPFTIFQYELLTTLNLSPSQLYSNSWALPGCLRSSIGASTSHLPLEYFFFFFWIQTDVYEQLGFIECYARPGNSFPLYVKLKSLER